MLRFDTMTDSTFEWMEAHGYYGNGPLWDVDKPCKHGTFTYDDMEYTVVVGHYDDVWFAETTDENLDAETQTSGLHPDIALIECLSYLIAPIAFAEEGNCEDAVYRVAYDTFSIMYRNENVAYTAEWPTGEHEMLMLDIMKGVARRAVKFFAADLWQEF